MPTMCAGLGTEKNGFFSLGTESLIGQHTQR